jgi:AmmeMemoRadiSam system protein A
MTEQEKKAVLSTARVCVEAAVRSEPPPGCIDKEPFLDEKRGVFVTLKTGGRLRGCIGRFDPDEPLRQLIPEMASAAATEDPRFFGDRLTPEELPQLRIEVSVLSPLEKTSDPMAIELGVHGIYLKRGYRSGCFLPQVATETGWSKEEFLSYCANHKAGLAPDAWKDPKTEVYTFTADIISEDE